MTHSHSASLPAAGAILAASILMSVGASLMEVMTARAQEPATPPIMTALDEPAAPMAAPAPPAPPAPIPTMLFSQVQTILPPTEIRVGPGISCRMDETVLMCSVAMPMP